MKNRLPVRLFSLTAAFGALALAACQPAADQPETDSPVIDVTVTAAFEEFEGGSGALAFLPDAEIPWRGFIVSAPQDGGVDLFDTEGELRARLAGPRLSGLAAAPGFELRGQALPLVFGADPREGVVNAYVVVRDRAEIVQAPLAPMALADGAFGLCLVREGVGYIEIAVLGRGASAEIWRIRDDGGDLISTQRVSSLDLPAPARACAAADDALIVSGPGSGIARIAPDGRRARALDDATHVAAGDFLGRRLVLASGGGGIVRAYDATDLSFVAETRVVDGLSTPGVARPGAIAVSRADFGFTAYSTGLVALYDEEDGRVKVVARDVYARAFAPRG
ncbi:MAG: hypothetical protein KIS81_01070 [Maricaulaceae bacterium]|nr:hypothetical protein [Maricaulaceae bacterium]